MSCPNISNNRTEFRSLNFSESEKRITYEGSFKSNTSSNMPYQASTRTFDSEPPFYLLIYFRSESAPFSRWLHGDLFLVPL